jgi:hypothetical protein
MFARTLARCFLAKSPAGRRPARRLFKSHLQFESLERRTVLAAAPFTLVAVPDTQYYSEDNPQIFHSQTQWIVNNKAAQNIAFVTQLGDIVQHGNSLAEYQNADAAIDRLDGVVPYSISCGNHDYTNNTPHSGATNFLNNFGPQRFAEYSWFKGASPNGLNSFQAFTAGGYNFLHLNLEYEPESENLDWAKSVLGAYANYPTIVSTHNYLSENGNRPRYPNSTGGNPGETMFQELVRPNPQVFLVLNGHFSSSTGESYVVSNNVAGTQVHQLCSDYQTHDGSTTTGLLRLMKFDMAANKIQVRTYSPYTNNYETDANSQFDININFAQRFQSKPLMTTAIFQEGVNAGYGTYRGAIDTTIGPPGMNVAGATGTNLTVGTANGQSSQTLLKFNTFIGVGQGLIPPNAKIVNAELVLNSNNAGNGAQLYRVQRYWDANSTWNWLGNGIQTNGVEAPVNPQGQIGSLSASGDAPVLNNLKVNVTADVQAWVHGQNNYGWLMNVFAGSTNDWGFTSSESSNLADRPRLMVTWLVENANLSTYQQGSGGYSGAIDTSIAEDSPTTSFGSTTTLTNDGPSPENPTSPNKQSFIKFNDFIGNGANQIPAGTTIKAAYLRLTTTYSSTSSHGAGFWAYRMAQNWNPNMTWAGNFGGNGVQADGVEARTTRELVSGFIDYGSHLFDLTSAVQAWINNPSVNFGVAMLNPNDQDDGTTYQSSENERAAERPQLIIIWNTAAAPAAAPSSSAMLPKSSLPEVTNQPISVAPIRGVGHESVRVSVIGLLPQFPAAGDLSQKRGDVRAETNGIAAVAGDRKNAHGSVKSVSTEVADKNKTTNDVATADSTAIIARRDGEDAPFDLELDGRKNGLLSNRCFF